MNLKEFFKSYFFGRICCRASRAERAFEQARSLLEKETNINSIIKQNRYFKLAFKRLLSKSERRELKAETKFRIVNPYSQSIVVHTQQEIIQEMSSVEPLAKNIDAKSEGKEGKVRSNGDNYSNRRVRTSRDYEESSQNIWKKHLRPISVSDMARAKSELPTAQVSLPPLVDQVKDYDFGGHDNYIEKGSPEQSRMEAATQLN